MTIDEFLEALRAYTVGPELAKRLQGGRERFGPEAVPGWKIMWGNEILLCLGPDLAEGRERTYLSPFAAVARHLGRAETFTTRGKIPDMIDMSPSGLGLTEKDARLLEKAIRGDPMYPQGIFPLLIPEQRSLRGGIKAAVGLEGEKDQQPQL